MKYFLVFVGGGSGAWLKILAVDGLEKVRAGLTTLDEVQIILGEEVIL